MKKCVISFANERGRYLQNLARLGESLKNNFDGHFLGFVGESSIGAPLHHDNPYAFKIYAFEQAIRAGYKQILWLDSSCFAIKNIQPIFDYINENGYIAQQAGHYLGRWCNDQTLAYFDITRENAMTIPMIGNAGFLGLDVSDTPGSFFYHQWKRSMEDGMFKGSWEDHRHDMSCSSALWYQRGMKVVKGNEWLQYAGPYDETLNDTIIIKAQG